MIYIYWIALFCVVVGHLYFAYGQCFKWPEICKELTKLSETEAMNTKSLGRSFASYNFSIAVGLILSFLLPDSLRSWTQVVVLTLVVFTAAVGAAGTEGNTILLKRLLPAAIALVALLMMLLA